MRASLPLPAAIPPESPPSPVLADSPARDAWPTTRRLGLPARSGPRAPQMIKVWPAQTSPPWECMETLAGHGDAVCCLAVTQNHVFSASSDGMLHMWKLV